MCVNARFTIDSSSSQSSRDKFRQNDLILPYSSEEFFYIMWQLLVNNIFDASAPGRADVPSALLISEQHGMIQCRQDGLRCPSCGSAWSLQRSKRRITHCASKYHGVCNNAGTKCQPVKYHKQTKQVEERFFPENSECFFFCFFFVIMRLDKVVIGAEKSSDIEEGRSSDPHFLLITSCMKKLSNYSGKLDMT